MPDDGTWKTDGSDAGDREDEVDSRRGEKRTGHMDDVRAPTGQLLDYILYGDGVEHSPTGIFGMRPFDHVETGLEGTGTPRDLLGNVIACADMSAEYSGVDHRVETYCVPSEENLKPFWWGKVNARRDCFVYLG